MALAGLPGPPLLAQDPAPTQRYDVPSEPLDQALSEFAALTHIDILYENNVVDGKYSSAVSGVLTREAALNALLRGTGLNHRFTSSSAALVYPADQLSYTAPSGASTAAPRLMLDPLHVTATTIGRPPRTGFEPYGRSVQREINRRLQLEAEATGETFRTVLAVRIDAAGSIQSLEVARTTGNLDLDRRLKALLLRARVAGPPPPDLPQPIWFRVEAAR